MLRLKREKYPFRKYIFLKLKMSVESENRYFIGIIKRFIVLEKIIIKTKFSQSLFHC